MADGVMGRCATVRAGDVLHRLKSAFSAGAPAAQAPAPGDREDPGVRAARGAFERRRQHMRRMIAALTAREASDPVDGSADDAAAMKPRTPSSPSRLLAFEIGMPPGDAPRSALDASLWRWMGLRVPEAHDDYLTAAPLTVALALLGAAGALVRLDPAAPGAAEPTSGRPEADPLLAPVFARAAAGEDVTPAAASMVRRALAAGGQAAPQRVAALQAALSAMGYGPDVVNGRFGPRTQVALEDFVADAGPPAAGTFAALAAHVEAAERAGHRALSSRNNPGLAQVHLVRLCQDLLAEMGYEPGPLDGAAGAQTLAAAQAFALDAAVAFDDFDPEFAALLREAAARGHAVDPSR